MQRDAGPVAAVSARTPQLQHQQQSQPKALRFVTNYGAPHPKRRRIGAACLTCRRRKTACSGERPCCETCKQNKLDCAGYSSECTTTTTAHKRTASQAVATTFSEQNDGQRGEPAAKKTSSSSRPPSNDLTSTLNVNELSRTASGGQSPRNVSRAKTLTPEDSRNSQEGQDSLFPRPRNRMPYFRWLGPTAIMPGFKQMVVKVKRQDTDAARSSTDGNAMRSPSLNNMPPSEQQVISAYSNGTAAVDPDMRTPLNLPFYDHSPMPPSELITHLANTFFTHLGCNYPFLQRERFLRDLEEKQVDAILVDAVCALAARFSTHSLLVQLATDGESKSGPAEYGRAFAQRAKIALLDAFACPNVAAAQAALLLAYNEFGEQRDSGLWMYLGISIRLAQDLGLQKLEGMKYIGREGPTPRMVKRQAQRADTPNGVESPMHDGEGKEERMQHAQKEQTPEEQMTEEETKAVEQERFDTFWAIFLLDRVVSSGTGRRSTLRDKDIELSFPPLSHSDDNSDWPAPFPALIRIVHLYGRVADLLNSIKEPSDITPDTPKRLAAMESQVTSFYQGLSPRLHFDAVHFQHYMKAGEGTNFVLLHFWFHLLIVLLHQPTLLKTFEGRMLQLFPNSQQLSMSSAKTIADILSYSQLMDAKAPLGNPFTTQPIYIAACAFLKETAEQTATSNVHSRAPSPTRSKAGGSEHALTVNGMGGPSFHKSSISQITNSQSPTTKSVEGADPKKQLAKHTLLAAAATQHYQLCYKALQSLETYWAGTKYILTILDQKFQGVGDPLLYTAEEAESSMEQPRPEPAFTSPGWRRKQSWGSSTSEAPLDPMQPAFWPPSGFAPGGTDPNKGIDCNMVNPTSSPRSNRRYSAIGWTLTGTMDSPSTNLAWHFAKGGSSQNPNLDPRLGSLNTEFEATTGQVQNVQYPGHSHAASTGSQQLPPQDALGRQAMQNFATGAPVVSMPETESIMDFNSPYSQQGRVHSTPDPMPPGTYPPAQMHSHMSCPTGSGPQMNGNMGQPYPTPPYTGGHTGSLPFMPGDMMMIESQDVDMSMLGLDMMPWFDSYPTHDIMPMYHPHGNVPVGVEAPGHRGPGHS